jgi:hypothetical protein
MAHTANFSVTVLEGVFRKEMITHGLWPPRSMDFSSLSIHLWGTLKDRVYMKNPRSLQEIKGSI